MASGNTVSLVFAGDSTSLERAMSNVGSGAKQMAGDLDSAEGKSRSFSGALDKAGEAAGNSEGKFMGAADLLDGLGGAFGLPTEGATSMFRAFGDLSGGFEVVSGLFPGLFAKLGTMIGLTGTQAAATEGAAVAQGGLNAMISANPIGAIVLAIGLLVGALVLAWQHSETFRDIVKGAFGVVKGLVDDVVGFFQDLPGKIQFMGSAIKDVIVWPFKTAFNLIADLWNGTVGRLSFEVPSWVPGLGGKGFSMPTLPTFHMGGVVPGAPGTEVPIMAMAGERITPAGKAAGGITVIVQGNILDGRQFQDYVQAALLRVQARNGSLGFT